MPLLNLSVGLCVRVCIIRYFLLISRAAQGRFPQTPDLWHRASVDERVELVLSHALSEWSRAPRCYKCRGVFRVARIVPFLVNSIFFFFERPRPAASMRPPHLIYLSTSNETRPRERSDRGCIFPTVRKSSSYRGAYRVPLLNLSVGLCVRVCIIHYFLLISRAAQGRFPQTPILWHRASVDERVELVLSHALSEWSRAPRCYKCRGVFRVARIVPFLVNSIFFFFERPRPAASMRPPYLIYLSTSCLLYTSDAADE